MKLTQAGFVELALMVDRINASLDNGLESVKEYELRSPLVPGYALAVFEAKEVVLERVMELCRASNSRFDDARFTDYVDNLKKEREEEEERNAERRRTERVERTEREGGAEKNTDNQVLGELSQS